MRPEKLTLKNIGPFRGLHSINFAELGSIFLIYGKTGAGKTTIFDALAYSFYGDAPGERKGLSRQMRSQFSADDEESAVELEFTLSARRYRIRRSLPFEKIGVRSGKIQNVAEEVTLEFLSPEGWQNKSSTNKSETDRIILDLIGLSAEEFSRIVLLPQGEFAQFLKQNSTERKAVLSKLFPVSQYERVTALARERARTLSGQLKETENAILALGERFNRLSYESDRGVLSAQADELRLAQTTLRRELGAKSALLEQARAVAAKQERYRLITEKLAVLEKSIPQIEAKKVSLQASRRAEPLMIQLVQIKQLAAQTAEQTTELSELEQELHAKTSARLTLEAQSADIENLKREKDSLFLRKDQLRVAVEIAGTLEAETGELAATRKTLAVLKKDIAALQADETILAGRLQELEEERSLFESRTDEANTARENLERAKSMRDLALEHAEEHKAIAAHTGAVLSLREQINANRQDIEIARAELTVLETEAEAARTGELASHLAAALIDGAPCPVCGSIKHPAPAVKATINTFTFAERIESGKRRTEQLEGRNAVLEKTLSGREADLRNAEEKSRHIVEKNLSVIAAVGVLDTDGKALPSPEEAAELVKLAALAMQNASDALNRGRSAYRESEEVSRKIHDITKKLSIIKEEQAKHERTEAEQKAGIEHKKARYKEAFPHGTAPLDAADALDQCAARILEIEAAIGTHEDKLKEAREKQSALTGKKSGLERSLTAIRHQLEEATRSFEKTRSEAGFADDAVIRQAYLDASEKEKLETDIEAFTESLTATRTGKTQLETELSVWNGPAPELAEAEIGELDRRITETDRQLEEKSAAVSALDALKTRWDELEKERTNRSTASSRLVSLADDLTGVNPLKTSFDAWILGMYLEEITAYANTRLERMSEGRYRIQLNESYRRGNSLSGLDLEIRDAYTGKTRPSGTLSGGETFMTSISLALGLADSIQSRSGGIQLDAVFIDEGFGSLDESSLERAITILDEIRGMRMVGLISHVAELRSRIPNRVEIVKTGAGSTIRNELSEAMYQGESQ